MYPAGQIGCASELHRQIPWRVCVKVGILDYVVVVIIVHHLSPAADSAV